MIFLLVTILILCIFNCVSIFVIGAALYRNSEILNNISSILTSMSPIRKKRLQSLVTTPAGGVPGLSEGLIEP